MEGEDSWGRSSFPMTQSLHCRTHVMFVTFELTRIPLRFFNPHSALWRRVDYSHVSCCFLRHQTWVGVEGQILLGRASGKLYHVCVRWSVAGGVREGCAGTLLTFSLPDTCVTRGEVICLTVGLWLELGIGNSGSLDARKKMFDV